VASRTTALTGRSALAAWVLLAACGGPAPSPPGDSPEGDTGDPIEDTGPEPIDADGDGYPAGVDCDDTRAPIHPGASPAIVAWCRMDYNCDGILDGDEDLDGDGVSWCGHDCDDADPTRAPGLPDPIDGIDQDCDGTDGVGELPGLRLYESETPVPQALGHTLLTADVNGDGCDDLIVSEPGFVSPGILVASTAQDPLIHAFLGCTDPIEQRSYEAPTGAMLWGIGQRLARWRRPAGDRVLAASQYAQGPEGVMRVLDFSTDPPMPGVPLFGDARNDVMGATVVHRESTYALASPISNGYSGPGRAWRLPLDEAVYSEPDVLWWPYEEDDMRGWGPLSYDRDGDGLEDLTVGSIWSTRGGRVEVYTAPGELSETWSSGDPLDVYFGKRPFPAPDLPQRGDAGLLAGGVVTLGNGALYLLPPLGPGSYTTDEASTVFMGEFELDWFGVSAAVGDVNGDELPDVVIGAPNNPNFTDGYAGVPGKVFVFLGPIEGRVLNRSSARVFVGRQPAEQFGFAVTLADLDGDGRKEIYVGAPGRTIDETEIPYGWTANGAVYRIDL